MDVVEERVCGPCSREHALWCTKGLSDRQYAHVMCHDVVAYEAPHQLARRGSGKVGAPNSEEDQ